MRSRFRNLISLIELIKLNLFHFSISIKFNIEKDNEMEVLI